MDEDKCDHKYVYLRTTQLTESGGYSIHYVQTDVFYCEKCLKQKSVEQSDWCREKPSWWAKAV